MLFLLLTCGFAFNCISMTNAYCSNDKDLQDHRCICDLKQSSIQCSSLPKRCYTCYRYKTIIFNKDVNILPAESFRYYDLFDYESNQSFTIQFAQIDSISSKTFSKILLKKDHTLVIQIAEYSSSSIPSKLFDQIKLESKSKFHLEIVNVTSSLLTIEPYAFHGIRHGFKSIFRCSILSIKHTIEFQSNSGTLTLPSYSKMELYFSNLIDVSLKEQSFNHLIQRELSQFEIHFDHFHQASIGSESFRNFHQFNQSHFHLIFANFQNIIIDHFLFSFITQFQSSIIFSLYNMTNDLCFPSETFTSIKQDLNSSFQLEVDYGKNIYLNSSTFSNISQHTQSKLSIILRNSMHVEFSHHSMRNISQRERSLIDIWIKYGRNLIFQSNSIENLDIQRSSMMRIGYFHSNGILHTDSNAFVNVHRDHDSQFLFQIVNSSDFYLRYLNLTSLEIVDRMLTDEDLCRIHDIPSHIPVKLIPETSCSCSIFYLYRHLHRILNPLMLKDLTPLCYFHLSPDEIEHEERKCLFQKQISRCNQIEKYQNLSISPGKCYQNSIYSHKSSSFISLVLTLPAMSFILICIYLIATCKQRIVIFNLFHRRKRSMFNEDSYEQLTHFNKEKSMDIVMKFDTITKLTLPYLYTSESSNFIISNPIQLNTNPLDDIE